MSDSIAVRTDQPALVTGASGFVGSHIVRLLCERGRQVRVFLRKTSNRAAFEGLNVQVYEGDVLDRDSLRRAMAGCGTVFHSVVDPRIWLTDPTPIYRNNVDGVVNSMEAALEAGVTRFIFTSTMGTLGLNPNGPVTEDIPFNWRDRAPPYILARLEAETRVLAYCRERGLPGVALCIANTYGPGDFGPTPHGNMLWQVASGRVKFGMAAAAPSVDIRDCAEAALLAEQYGRVGERYIIANEFLSNRDLYAMAAAEMGNPPPRMIPMPVMKAVAAVGERIYKLLGKKDYLLRSDAIYLAEAFREMDHSKASRELHWQPRPVRETVRDAVAWYRAHAPAGPAQS